MSSRSGKAAAGTSAEWHAMAIGGVVEKLATDTARGLSSKEAARRLAIHGPNRISEGAAVSPLTIFARQFTSLVIWVLIAAAAISALMGDVIDAVAIVAIVVLNSVIGFAQEYRAETAVAELRRMTAPKANVMRDAEVRTIPASAIVPGDLLFVGAGDLVTADARLVEAAGLQTNEAALTGESSPVSKSPGECVAAAPLAERANMIFLGTAVTRGSGRAVVVASAMQTEFGKIAELLMTASSDETPLQRKLEQVAHRLLWFCLGIVVVVFALGLLRSVPLFEMFLGAVSLAVAAIPEGLPAVVTVALALGVARMARRSALVRRMHSVETLGCTQVICTDKTGTLTVGEMTVSRVVTGDRVYNVTGEGYSTDGAIFADGEIAADGEPVLQELLRVAAGCNDAHLRTDDGKPSIAGDPTEGALLVLAAKGGVTADGIEARMPAVGVIPFTSERKLMTVIRKSSEGQWALVKGAPETVLGQCTRIRSRQGVRPLDSGDYARMTQAAALLASDALRVIACAQRPLSTRFAPSGQPGEEAERDLEFLGLVGMQDPPRAEAHDAVRKCKLAGIRAVMITGDHPDTAAAVARGLGILSPGDAILSGPELETMSDDELVARVRSVSVYARVTAEHKIRIVRAWKTHGAVVAMTGDGVNDAPALKEAAVGVAMGVSGTEVTKQAADIVIADDNFASIMAAVEEGRGIYDNIAKTLLYLMGGNSGELTVMLIAAVVGWPLPLLPTQLLWINLVTDGLPALALATDPVDRDVLARPPRNPAARLIDREFIGWAALTGCLTAAAALSAFGYGIHRGMGLPWARNAAFLVLVVAELMRSFGARSATKTIWDIGLLSNVRLLAVVTLSFALQLAISATPFFETIFQTQRVNLYQCLAGIAVGTVPLLVLQSVKAARRRARQTQGPPLRLRGRTTLHRRRP